ncbi:AbrB family transcriptional regulator [Alteromonadaceae bacterium M269]|nr:AbrB family transcriptional regulator [Alteromonadaceae bacterium M269]
MKATVDSEGSMTLPEKVIKDLNIVAGDRVTFVKLDENHYGLAASNRDVKTLKGMFKSSKVVTIEDMNKAISNEIMDTSVI